MNLNSIRITSVWKPVETGIYFFYKRFHALKIKYVNNTYTFGNTTKATTYRVQNNSTFYLS